MSSPDGGEIFDILIELSTGYPRKRVPPAGDFRRPLTAFILPDDNLHRDLKSRRGRFFRVSRPESHLDD